MSVPSEKTGSVHLDVSNVGGIDHTEVTFEPGVTVLAGRNATNRTSLLQAIMAGLGSTDVSLKADAAEGRVEFTTGGETYSRTLQRTDGTVVHEGETYLNDPDLADLFCFLLESNEARRAVVGDDDLRELIMRPIDTAEINRQIESLQANRRSIDDRIATIESREDQLVELERDLEELDEEIATKQRAVESVEADIESADVALEDRRQEQTEQEQTLTALSDARSDLQDVRAELERKEDSLARLRERRAELERETEQFSEPAETDVDEIDARIDKLRSEVQQINSTVNEVQTIIQFNEDKLTESNSEISATLGPESSSGAVTDRLVEDTETVCWTCGSEVETTAIESVLEQLRTLNRNKLDRKQELKAEITELEERKSTYEKRVRQREQLQAELDDVETNIRQRETRIEELREREATLEADSADLEETLESLETSDDEVLELHREASELEGELKRLHRQRDDVADEIEAIESLQTDRERLEAEREKIADRLEDLRTKIDRIEAEAVEAFNEHMSAVLSILEFENVERIWIERKQRERREGRRTVEQSVFDLHVVRSSRDGTVYEDEIGNLSESERETTGVVFALAGYLVHEVYETVPFMLLDSLEAIDADRVGDLVAYLSDFAEYLVVALLPEDASAVDIDHHTVSDI
jgi:chromosome segregation ATPase